MADPRQLPKETKTKAYVATYVPKLWASFNRADLVDGMLGNSDPLDLRSTFKEFKFEFDKDKGMKYTLKLLNPTSELEQALVRHFGSLYPTQKSAFENIVLDTSKVTGQEGTSINLDGPVTFPQLFLRWGYGEETEEGLSHIHKAIVTTIEFSLNANKDKEAIVTLVDTLSFTKNNPVFTEKDYAVTIPITFDRKYRKPSEVVSELLSKYSNIFPGTLAYVNLYKGASKIADAIDAAFSRMVGALNSADILEVEKAISGEESSLKPTEADFSPKELDSLNRLLTSPISLPNSEFADRDSKVIGGRITHSVVGLAYKFLLEQLGINFRQSFELSDTELVSANISRSQLGPDTDVPEDLVQAANTPILPQEELGKTFEDYMDTKMIEPFIVEYFSPVFTESGHLIFNEGDIAYGPIARFNTLQGLALDSNNAKLSLNDLDALLQGKLGYGRVEGHPRVGIVGVEPFWTGGSPGAGGYVDSRTKFELTQPGVDTVRLVYAKHVEAYEQSNNQENLAAAFDPDIGVHDDGMPRRGRKKDPSYFATIGTLGTTPIDKVLSNFIAGLNSFTLGSALSPLEMQPIYTYMLSDSQEDLLLDALGRSSQVNKVDLSDDESDEYTTITKEDLQGVDQVLVIATGDTLRDDFASFMTAKIFSWPEITSEAIEHDYIAFLRYGFPDSTVGSINFKSDQRVLLDLMNSHYTTRQQNDFREFFGPTQGGAAEKVSNLIIYLRQRENLAPQAGKTYLSPDIRPVGDPQTGRIITYLYTVRENLVEQLQALARDYISDSKRFKALVDESPDFSEKDFRVFLSVLTDENLVNAIFPYDSGIDHVTNARHGKVIYILADGKMKAKVAQSPLQRRRLDMSIVEQLAGGGISRMANTESTFLLSVQRQAWDVRLSVLGIPEMDNPVAEIRNRRVFLQVREPRSPDSDHWLSGPYIIIGMNHKLSPTKGYITELSLIKDPAILTKFGNIYQQTSTT